MPYRVLTNHLHKRKEKMKTNYILLFALMLMVSLKSSAQIFSGRVIGENQLPVEYATVALLSVPDSALVGGAVTDSKGVFKITAQDAGPYLLSVSFVSFVSCYSLALSWSLLIAFGGGLLVSISMSLG